MKEIKLEAILIFGSRMEISVKDFPDGEKCRERERCRVSLEYAKSDVDELIKKGLDLDGAIDYYKDWLYNVIKVNISQDWIPIEGYDEVFTIVEEHIKKYF